MRTSAIFPAWGRILRGQHPFLAIEITRECPLRCPGCYAFEQEHLGGGRSLRLLEEFRGGDLVDGVMMLVRESRPLHLSLIGGEPLLRHREITEILRRTEAMNIEVQVVTSAALPIPETWANHSNLHLVVSIDGLAPEHDVRRRPATYQRILRNLGNHRVVVHCTIIPLFLSRPDYLKEFVETWSAHRGVQKIWFSLFTPQKGAAGPERLTPGQRIAAIERISGLRRAYPKLHAPEMLINGYRRPPSSPAECIFAQVTRCVSADLSTPVQPCQIGGVPECSECGCVAAAAFTSVGEVRLGGFLRVGDIFTMSRRVGMRRTANALTLSP